MDINQNERQGQYEKVKAPQVSRPQSSSTCRESFDSGVGSYIENDYEYSTDDTEPLVTRLKTQNPKVTNKTSNNIYKTLRAIKKGKRKFEKWQEKGSVDINNIRGEKGNNILHLIALLKKKQKCKSLSILIEKISGPAQLVDSKNQDGKTPLQMALIDETTKGKHGSHTIQDNDNTLKFFLALLIHGVNPDQLELAKETLYGLKEKQKAYYLKFLKRLVMLVKKSELDQETKNLIIIKAAEIIYDGYSLHKAFLNKDQNKLSEPLQRGYDITKKDKDGNNALHLIVRELEKNQKLDFLNIVLNVSEEGGKEQLKARFKKAVNAKNKKEKEQTPLHQLLRHMGEKGENRSLKKFEETNRYKVLEILLQNGADITIQDKKGNNALHHIASFKEKQKVTCLELILDLVKKGKISADQLREAINAKNKDEKTPIQIVLITKAIKDTHNPIALEDNTIKFCEKLLQKGADHNQLKLPESNLSQKQETYYCKFLLPKLNKLMQKSGLDQETKKSLTINNTEIANRNIGEFKKLLKSGYDITSQDGKGNNVLHRIALLEGEKKVACLKSILDSVEKGIISKDQLSKAVKATNGEKNTPLQVALKAKAKKGECLKLKEYQYQRKIFDNTVKFCVKLLKKGADPNSLWLEDEKFHTKKYYVVLLNLKDNQKIPQEARGKSKEFTERLEARYDCRATCKRPSFLVGAFMKKTGNGLKAVWKCIDPVRRASVLLAITVATTIITMVTLSCFQGQIAIGVALPIIAITGMVCLIFTLGFSGIKKSLKELTTDEQSMSNKRDAQQNSAKNSEEQKAQESQGQSKLIKSPPSSKTYGVSISQVINGSLGFNEQINKPSFPAQ
ncbi:ankyrin repeat domain-containing protein [Wolbachia pipientis]|uniref:ankyrin repeat domain-containing protein n=1 Tax=Wolbachia pipientis TaxID=955 RepID=UPI0025A36348|nr:ankyrin repeat domain-containing protein [Wolbachia pipientis]MDM8335177.1 hypothetical protein [Wolbachia pipientis]